MITTIEKDYLEEVRDLLHEHGFQGIRYYIKGEKVSIVNVDMNEIDYVEKSEELLCFAEGGKAGKKCCTYFNLFSDKDGILKRMEDSSKAANSEYVYNPIKDKDKSLGYEANGGQEECPNISEVLKKLKDAEAAAYEVESVYYINKCEYKEYKEEILMIDDSGNTVLDSSGYCSGTIGIVAEKNGDKNIASEYVFGDDLSALDLKKMARNAGRKAVQGLGGKALPSGKYKAIIQNSVMAEILEGFLPIFYGDYVQDGISKFKDSIGKRVANTTIDFIEDPFYKGGRTRRYIDDEGNKVQRKYIIEKGVLKNILYNNDSAKKANIISTGNGFKSSISSEVGVNITNVLLCGSEITPIVSLYDEITNGVVVTSVDGVFAGVNINNGDFSLIAKGNLIYDSELKDAFSDVTISGNIYEVLNNILLLGDDLASAPPYCASVISPSVLVNEITISGS